MNTTPTPSVSGRSVTGTVSVFVLLLLCDAASALAQPGSVYQLRVAGTCPPGSSIRQINSDGSVVCQVDTNSGGTVTSVGTGSGLTGGPITASGTISIATGGVTSAHIADGTVAAADVNAAQVQLRVGSCTPGNAIRAVNADGSVTCQTVGTGTVTAVTASSPLVSSGGGTPNISLPGVTIDPANTAIGAAALFSNTDGFGNTATGVQALFSNTGNTNTASGGYALFSNTEGNGNTAGGYQTLVRNTTGGANTASGTNALYSNITGHNNTASGSGALFGNTDGSGNTASGAFALYNNTGRDNTASGFNALISNTTGNNNTAVGVEANVSFGDLQNATALGAGAVVDASNKIRLGDANVTVVEGPPYSVISDKTKKENFQRVDEDEVLRKIRGLTLASWNFIGQDPAQFRHYGPVAQEFFAAFGHDGIGTIGTPTTITSTDIAGVLMIAVQALETRTADLQRENELLKETVDASKRENTRLQAKLAALENRIVAQETRQPK